MRWKIKCLLAIMALSLLLPSFNTPALAYNRGNAVAYANQWALSRNWLSYGSYTDDCTNFVSQALNAGGYKQVGGNKNSDNAWYYNSDLDQPSLTWVNAPHNFQFQINHNPGGVVEQVTSWRTDGLKYKASFDNLYVNQGDVLYYDWSGTDGIDHSALQVPPGYSQYMPKGQSWYADLVDAHTVDLYHVSWSMLEVNPQWPTTIIYEVHIGDGN